jgi:hypothetical protein
MTQFDRAAELALAHTKTVISLLALATHYILHSREWDNRFHYFLGLWLVSFSGLGAAEYLYDTEEKSISKAVQTTATAAAVYFGTLTASILIYRGFFHRLRRVRSNPSLHSHKSLTLPDSWTVPRTLLQILRHLRRCSPIVPILQMERETSKRVQDRCHSNWSSGSHYLLRRCHSSHPWRNVTVQERTLVRSL